MADASRKLPWAADIYARDYIPQALLAVNDSPATVVPPSASLEIDYSAYISTYAGTSFLKQLPEVGWAQLRGPINYRSNTELSPEVYGQFFEECMLLETEAQSK